MERAVPWQPLEALIEPHYPKIGGDRPPYSLSAMLRIHCLQQWYGLSDPAMEEALYEIASMRQFAGLSLARGAFVSGHDEPPVALAIAFLTPILLFLASLRIPSWRALVVSIPPVL